MWPGGRRAPRGRGADPRRAPGRPGALRGRSCGRRRREGVSPVPRAPRGAGGPSPPSARRDFGPRADRPRLRRAREPLPAPRLRAGRAGGAGPDRRRPERARRFTRGGPCGQRRRRASGSLRELPESASRSPSRRPSARYRLPEGTLLVVDRAVARAPSSPRARASASRARSATTPSLAPLAAGRVASPWLHNTDADIAPARATTSSRPQFVGSRRSRRRDLLLRPPVRRGPGPRGGRAPLRDLAALLRARPRLGRIALRVPEHGKLPRDPRRVLRGRAGLSAEERRGGLLRPRQAREGRRDRAARRRAADPRGPALRPRALRHGPRAAGPRRRRSAGARRLPPVPPARLRASRGVARRPRRASPRTGGSLRRGARDAAALRQPFFRADLLAEALEKLGAFAAIREARGTRRPTPRRSAGTSTPGSTPSAR